MTDALTANRSGGIFGCGDSVATTALSYGYDSSCCSFCGSGDHDTIKSHCPQSGCFVATANRQLKIRHFLRCCDRVLRLRRNTHWHKHASFDSLLSRVGLGHFGRGWNVRGTTTRRWPYCANGLSSTRAGTGCTDSQLISSSVDDCQVIT